MRIQAGFCANSSTGNNKQRQLQLWEGLISHPWDWWDNRRDKKSPLHPDFRHRSSREPLWLDSPYKPSWVDACLPALDAHDVNDPYASWQNAVQSLCQNGDLGSAVALASSCLTTAPHNYISQDVNVYVALLNACGKSKCLPHARQVQKLISKENLNASTVLKDHLVVALSKCGAIDDALTILLSLPYRTAYTWTALISGCIAWQGGRAALQMYCLMQEDGVEPDEYTFVSLFKACASIPDLEAAANIHKDAERKGYTSNVFVGSILVSMYAKCGTISRAESVFEEFSERDVVSWNAMLSAYVEVGQQVKALQLYRQMQEERTSPDKNTIGIVLQACSNLGGRGKTNARWQWPVQLVLLTIGQALHATLYQKHFSTDVFVGSILVSLYGNCGSILEAEHVFHELSNCDIVLWSAMISAYVEQGHGVKALQLYRQMHLEGVNPDEQTILVALQACGYITCEEEFVINLTLLPAELCLEIGLALHADVCEKALTSNAFVGSALVSMYGKSASIMEAENVFKRLSKCGDVVLWNSMMSAYIEQDRGIEALQLFRQMQEEGRSPDYRTFVLTFHACSSLGVEEVLVEGERALNLSCKLDLGRCLHAEVLMKGLSSNTFIGSSLVTMYGKCGSIVEAENVFDGFLYFDTVLWNSLISLYIEQGQGVHALRLYRQMQEEGTSPDQETFLIVFRACSIVGSKDEALVVEGLSMKAVSPCLEIGRALHAEACRNSLAFGVCVGSTLVSMYGKCGSIIEAKKVFNGMPKGHVVSWNAMISAYVDQAQGVEALEVYRHMEEEGIASNEITAMGVLEACKLTGDVEVCKQMHFKVTFAGYDDFPSVESALVRAYGSCANMHDAQAVVDGLCQADAMLWNACMAGYGQVGENVACLYMFEQMQTSCMIPTEATFLSVLCACSHAGFVNKGIQHFTSMSRDYGLIPSLKHYIVMIDLLGRAGDLKVVDVMLLGMPMQIDVSAWLRLLSACCQHGHGELGKQAFDQAISLNPQEAAAYVLMSNICADAELYEWK